MVITNRFEKRKKKMILGCFPVRSKKKRGSVSMKRTEPEESQPTALPEPPKIPSRNLQSAPPSFKTRVKPIHSNNNGGPGGGGMSSSRARVMSAPSSIHGVVDRDFLSGANLEEQDEQQPRDSRSSTKESNPQPLPLPSPKTASSSLKNWGSFKSFNGRSSQVSASAGPLPLPPSGSVRSFSYDEVVSACQAFSSDRCVSEGLSSVVYMASFGDEASTANLKKVEATVVRLHVTTTQVNEKHFIGYMIVTIF